MSDLSPRRPISESSDCRNAKPKKPERSVFPRAESPWKGELSSLPLLAHVRNGEKLAQKCEKLREFLIVLMRWLLARC